MSRDKFYVEEINFYQTNFVRYVDNRALILSHTTNQGSIYDPSVIRDRLHEFFSGYIEMDCLKFYLVH